MDEIELKLTQNEVQAIIGVLGNLPTATGVWPLMMKLQAQLQSSTTSKGEQQ